MSTEGAAPSALDLALDRIPGLRPGLCTSGPSSLDCRTIANRAANGESCSPKGFLGTLHQSIRVAGGG